MRGPCTQIGTRPGGRWSFETPPGRRSVVLVFAALLMTTAPLAHATPGDLDPAFGASGYVLTGFGYGEDIGTAMAVQADGKLVMAGYSDSEQSPPGFGDLLLVRYDTNDVLDPSFGVGGIVRTPMPAPGALVEAMAIQADGKIVLAGILQNATTTGDFLLVRYNTDGSLDGTFNGDGIVVEDMGGNDGALGIAIQADGKIVAVGQAVVGSTSDVVVARYNTDGTLDPSFNDDGVNYPITGAATGVAIQTDGKISVTGESQGMPIVLRYLPSNGTLDASFDGDGVARTTIPGASSAAGYGIAFQGSQIVVAGYGFIGSSYDFVVIRYNPSGLLDVSFGGDGIVTTAVGTSTDVAKAVLVQGSTITVAGYTQTGSHYDFAVVRYNLSGALDVAFNGTGKRVTAVSSDQDQGMAMVLQSGKVVVGGFATTPTNRDFALVRYNTNGTLDATLDGDGIKTQDIVDRGASMQDLAIQPDGKIVAVGLAYRTSSNRMDGVARYEASGALDPTFGSNGKVAYTMSDGGSAVAVQPDGKIVVGGTDRGLFSVLRLNADGSLDGTWGGGDNVDTPIGSNAGAHAVALQPDGKVVVAGTATIGGQLDMALIRLNPNGTLDTSFDGDGIVTTAFASGDDYAMEVKILADGKILVAGAAVVAGNEDFALVRYNANGSLDNTFGSFGRVATDFGGATRDFGYGMTIQPDGKIVVVGATLHSTFDIAVARYNANGTLDTSFDGDGRVTTPIGLETDAAYAVALQADGKLLVAGQCLIGAEMKIAVVRYGANGALDPGFGAGGKIVHDLAPGYGVATAIALDAAGRAIVGGEAGARYFVARLLGDGIVGVAMDPVSTVTSRIQLVAPNPAAGSQMFFVSVAPGRDVTSVSVFDVAGQRVWRRELTGLSAGTHRFEWNGRTSDGRTAPPGIYFARLDGSGGASYRVVRVW